MTRERELKMTEQEHNFDLAAGTVPDPFGLGWVLERDASEEEESPDAEVRGSTTTASDADHDRLGELD